MAQYIVHKDTNRGGYRSYTKNADRLKRYDSLVEARAHAIKEWKKIGDSMVWFAIEKVTPREKGWYGDSGWNYDNIGWVYGDFRHYSRKSDKNYFRFYYVTWAGQLKKKPIDPHARPRTIEIAENGQTMKMSQNPNIASPINKNRKMPFGL